MSNHQNLPIGSSAELQSRAINAAQDGIVIVDALAEDMPIIWANQGFLTLTGYGIDEVLGHNCRFLHGPNTDRTTMDTIRECLRQKVYVQQEILNYRKDGSEFWNELSISPVSSEMNGGQVTHFIGVQNDISGRVQAQKNFEGERRVVEALQQSLLMTLPSDAAQGLTFSHYYEAFGAAENRIGGDFFDYFLVPDNQVALVIGDVQGKGLEAATQIAQVKYSLRALLREAPRPSRGLLRMNELLNEVGFYGVPKEGRLVSASIALIDTETGEGSISVAGMDAPLIVRANGTVEQVGASGTPLGTDKDARYEIVPFRLERDATLLMVTDGVTEARGASGEFLDVDGLARELTAGHYGRSSADEICRATRGIAERHSGGRRHDDVCVLVAKRSGE